ncbi:MAG: hypothetical protein WBW79_07830 [Desulfocapsaceae bacterium]
MRKKAKTARIIVSVYLFLVIASFLIMIFTAASTPMAGIYLVLFTFPWPGILSQIVDSFQQNSFWFNGLFLLAGGLINGFVLYVVISFIGRLFQRR